MGSSWAKVMLRSEGAAESNKARVYEHIKKHPGIHLRKMCRDLGLAMGDVQYHVNLLEKDGSVQSSRHGLYRHFYAAGLFAENQSLILGVLAQETPRELLLLLIAAPGSNQEELAASLHLSAPTISWNMKRLVDLGLVRREQRGRSATYTVLGDSVEIGEYISSYHPSVWERWSSRLTEIVLAMSEGGTPPK
ncbi:MAG: winged helix-turn-helix transcriptional regulator [Nitrososphaerales archaeon]